MFFCDDTIIAQCTPRGPGALALIRLVGAQAFICAEKISKMPDDKKISSCLTHTIEYGKIVDAAGAIIDNVLFFLMRAPRTFTGHDTVEITCHNNQFIIEGIIEAAILQGARVAYPGEFSQRAVLAGKYDLIQAEAINELIHAQTQQGLKQSLLQLQGTLSVVIESIEKKLILALALTEASFEFLDDEIEFAPRIFSLISEVRAMIAPLKESFAYQQQIRTGMRIALLGSVNAGKSSLFNILVGTERTIVSACAGTTRDAIEASLYQNGMHITFVDTAGLRETGDQIEREGMKKSYEQAACADIILLVYDMSRPLTHQESLFYTSLFEQYCNKILVVANKSDVASEMCQFLKQPDCSVSTFDKSGIDHLSHLITQKITHFFGTTACPFLLNARQHNLIIHCDRELTELSDRFEQKPHYELIAHHLTVSIAHLGELTGKTVSEAAMNAVFREFCVGK
jgi:tRNA modification GTPase